jgi:hypothetical protein
MLSGTGPRLAVRSRVKSTEPANKIECETRSQRRTRHPPPVGHRKRLHWAGMVMLSRDDDVVHLQRSRTRPPQITSPITPPARRPGKTVYASNVKPPPGTTTPS